MEAQLVMHCIQFDTKPSVSSNSCCSDFSRKRLWISQRETEQEVYQRKKTDLFPSQVSMNCSLKWTCDYSTVFGGKKSYLAKAANPWVTSVFQTCKDISSARPHIPRPKSLLHALQQFVHQLKVLSGALLHALLDAQHQVNEPVDLDHPALFPADLDLVQQVVLCFIVAAAHGQRLADVLNVLLAGQLRHACPVAGQKHWEWAARMWNW